MNNLWLNLLWKEWCEHRWKLLALVTIAIAMVVLTQPKNAFNWWENASTILWMLIGATGMFIALGDAAGENSHGTRPFIESQPIAMWKLGLAKLLVGGATAAAPGIVAFSLLAVIENVGPLFWPSLEDGFRRSLPLPSGFGSYYVFAIAVSTATALTFYLWGVAVAARTTNEVRAAAYALGFIVCWFLVMALGTLAIERLRPWSEGWLELAMLRVGSAGPLGYIAGHAATLRAPSFWGQWPFLVSHCLLAVIFLVRFQKSVSPARDSGSEPLAVGPVRSDSFEQWAQAQREAFLSGSDRQLVSPFKNAFDALVWKGVRECLPIVAIGFAAAIGVTALMVVLETFEHTVPGRLRADMVAQFLVVMLTLFGSFVAVVIGIGAVWHDLSAKLHTFWLSRPIRPDHVFWLQYLTAVSVLLLVFAAPVEGLLATKFADNPEGFSGGYITAFLLSAFSLAVLFTTVLRSPIYAAILAFGVAISTLVEMTARSQPVVGVTGVAVLLTIAVVATLVAWTCFRKDLALRN